MPDLQILTPDGKRRIFPLSDKPVTLGRAPHCDLSYPDDSGLSRQHLTIERKDGTFFVTDLASKNGTVHNGKRISAPTQLHPGDRMMAGHLILTLIASKVQTPASHVSFFPGADSANATVIFTEQDNAPSATLEMSQIIQGKSVAPQDVRDPLNALIRAGNELSGQRPLPELFPLILQLALDAVGAQRGVLFTLESDTLHLQATQGEGFRISNSVRDRVLQQKQSLLIRDTSADDAFRESHSLIASNISTFMAVPLQTRDCMVGLLYVDTPTGIREFSKEELNLLAVIANVAAIRIEQSRFAEREKTRELLERELGQAAAIQRQCLPDAPPKIPQLELAGFNTPCRTVGGDYFAFFPYPDSSVGLILGDVSGKGMPASLMMMGLQARAEVLLREPCCLSDALTNLNSLTAQHCPPGKFITLFLCRLNAQTGELIYANAGHNPPVILRADGSSKKLTEGGPVMGIIPNLAYQEFRTELHPGELLAIYSDGVTEAASPADEEFETEHLIESLEASRNLPLTEAIGAVTRALDAWTEHAPPADDITLVLARRTADTPVY